MDTSRKLSLILFLVRWAHRLYDLRRFLKRRPTLEEVWDTIPFDLPAEAFEDGKPAEAKPKLKVQMARSQTTPRRSFYVVGSERPEGPNEGSTK